MKLSDGFNLINYYCNKEQSGNTISISQYNLLLQSNLTKYIDNLYSEYERTKKIGATFQILRTNLVPDMLLDSNGNADLPDDFLFTDGIIYRQTIGSNTYNRQVDELTSSEYNKRIGSTLTKPTYKHPIVQLFSNKVHCEPIRNGYLKFQYIRKPVTPYLDYYIDLNNVLVPRDENDNSKFILTGDVHNEISNLSLTGFTDLNTDGGYLYWDLLYNNPNFILSFYKDIDKTELVCSGQSSTNGHVVLSEANSSGISGSYTLTMFPHLTLTGNDLNLINSIEFYSYKNSELYWEIRCYINLTGTDLTRQTVFTLYSDSIKLHRIYSIDTIGVNMNTEIEFNGYDAQISLSNTQSSTINSSFHGASSIVTDFAISYPNLPNRINYYYSLTDNSTSRIFEVFSDSGLTNKIMSGVSNFPFNTPIIPLSQSNYSGYGGYAKVEIINGYNIEGDSGQAYAITGSDVVSSYTNFISTGDTLGQLGTIIINGANATNTNAGTLYVLLVNPVGGVYAITLYKDAGYTYPVATGTRNSIYGDVQLFSENNSGITGNISIIYSAGISSGVTIVASSSVSVNQLTNIKLSGVTNAYSSSGTLYFIMEVGSYNEIYIKIYKESSHTNMVAIGSNYIGEVNITPVGNSNIYGSVYLNYIQQDLRNTNTFHPVGQPVSQLSNLVLNGVNGENSNNGTLYWNIINNGAVYQVNVYKDASHKNLVSNGDISSSIGTVTLTSAYSSGVSGSVDINYQVDDIDTLNKFVLLSGGKSHTGEIIYVNGDWDITNKITLYQANDPSNTLLYLPTSKTQEIELRDEDTLRIFNMCLSDIGINLKDEAIYKYALEHSIVTK